MESLHYYLELSENPIRFDPVSDLTNVFFDDSNRQVFAVRSGGVTGVTAKGPEENNSLTFCMDDKGPIRSIKFSPDNNILAIQRIEFSVEFLPFVNNQPILGDALTLKRKNSEIIGFVWINTKELVLFSNVGIELISINFEKKLTKSIKSLNITIKWFAWCSTGKFALLSSSNGRILTPILFKSGTITKLPRIELDSNDKAEYERDVTLAQLYGVSSILILRQTIDRLIEVVVYSLNGPGLAPVKSHILKLGCSGRFAINIVDDLIIVHHQASATSLLFDIGIEIEKDLNTGVAIQTPIIPGKSIKPFILKIPCISLDEKTMKCELYSKNWVLFQPNIIIDARLGCFWYLNLKLTSLSILIPDYLKLFDLLLLRTDGKATLINLLKDMINENQITTSLLIIEKLFDKINNVYKLHLDQEIQGQMGISSSSKNLNLTNISLLRVVINQQDMYTNVFSTNTTEKIGHVLMIYLYSLLKYNIAPQEELTRMLTIDLVSRKDNSTLQQLIEHAVFNESKQLACFLLSMGNLDSSITQMALDMLFRLNANEIIVEVLLGQGKVIDALRLAKTITMDNLSARKFLEAAQNTNDPLIYHSVYHFIIRNFSSRTNLLISTSEQFNEYNKYYQSIFLK